MNMEIRNKILQALEMRAQAQQELAASVEVTEDAHEFVKALYHLNQESLIVKHPIIDGGCKTCACGITYKWRLTLSGRNYLKQTTGQNKHE
jgi:Fe-S cluster assembly iron-binding protein IscA